MIVAVSTRCIPELGDTDDTTMYRDTDFQRYWYRHDDDTFWYSVTTNIGVLMTIFSASRPAENHFYLLREYFSFAFVSKIVKVLSHCTALCSVHQPTIPFHDVYYQLSS